MDVCVCFVPPSPRLFSRERSDTPTRPQTRSLPGCQLCPEPAAGSPFSLLLLVTLAAAVARLTLIPKSAFLFTFPFIRHVALNLLFV